VERRHVVRRTGITLSLVALLLAALALPSGAPASDLSRADFKSVSKYCKALRAEMGTKAFKRAFGKSKRVRRAHRRCVARRGEIPKVSLRSQAPPPAECPPGTVPEPPQPVSAFAVTPAVCVALPLAPPSAAPVDDEDGDEDEAEEDGESDDDHGDESDDDDHGDESDDHDRRGSADDD
jgi:hypothetical protein